LVTRPWRSSVVTVSRPSAVRAVTVWSSRFVALPAEYVQVEVSVPSRNVERISVALNGSVGSASEARSSRVVRSVFPPGVSISVSTTTGTREFQRGSVPVSTVVFVPSGAVTTVRPSVLTTEAVSAPLGSRTVRCRSPFGSTSIE
jgi:hypothetical protein